MNYHTFKPNSDLAALVKCYWTLEVPAQKEFERQLVLPDGCVDMCFILGADIKRYTTKTDFVIQPRQMLLGQITEPFYIEPTGYVNTFAVRFYPYGIANFMDRPLWQLGNKETPLRELFGDEETGLLTKAIIQANTTDERISTLETFLLHRLRDKATVDSIVKSTIDTMYLAKGSESVQAILKDDIAKRRQLEGSL